MMMFVKWCMKALKIVGKFVGALVKVIHHAVEVHKAKKAAAAQAAAAQHAQAVQATQRKYYWAGGIVLLLVLVGAIVYMISET